MKHEFNEDRSQLILLLDGEERESLRELLEDRHRGWLEVEAEFMADYLANCELDWVDPADTGDLTAAPMLGITGGDDDVIGESDPLPENCYGRQLVGAWDGQQRYVPILERWGFMSYALRSFLSDLAADGRAVFVNSN